MKPVNKRQVLFWSTPCLKLCKARFVRDFCDSSIGVTLSNMLIVHFCASFSGSEVILLGCQFTAKWESIGNWSNATAAEPTFTMFERCARKGSLQLWLKLSIVCRRKGMTVTESHNTLQVVWHVWQQWKLSPIIFAPFPRRSARHCL